MAYHTVVTGYSPRKEPQRVGTGYVMSGGTPAAVTSLYAATTVSSLYSPTEITLPTEDFSKHPEVLAWNAAVPVRPSVPKLCVPDAQYQQYWEKSGRVLAKSTSAGTQEILFEQLSQKDMGKLCNCVRSLFPSDAISSTPYDTAPVDVSDKKVAFANYVAGTPNSQKRVDFCWTKLLRAGKLNFQIVMGHNPSSQQKRMVDAANKEILAATTNQGLGPNQRAQDFPNPCNVAGRAAWESRASRVAADYFIPAFAPGTSVPQAFPLPLRCSKVSEKLASVQASRPGQLLRAEKSILTNDPLFVFGNNVADQSVSVLNPSKPGTFLPGTYTAPVFTGVVLDKIAALNTLRAAEREKNPLAGVPVMEAPAGAAATHALMIAGTVVAVLGLSAFVYATTR